MFSICTSKRVSLLAQAIGGLILVLPFTCVNAQQTASQPVSSQDEIQSAPVNLDGQTLFRIRGVSAYPAEQRAQSIVGRIVDVAKDHTFDAQNIRVNEASFSTQIVAGNLVIVNLFDADAQLEHVRRQSLAAAYLIRIQQAIGEYRHERQRDVLIRRAMLALAATVGLLLFLFLSIKFLQFVIRSVERRYKHRVHEVGIQSLKLLPAERMWASIVGILKLIAAAVGALAIYLTLDYVLSLFPWTRELSRNLSGFVLNPLRTIANKFVASIPNLIFLIILGIITYYLLKFIKIFFSSLENETIKIGGFDPLWSKPTYRLVRVFVIAFALVVAFPYIPGSNTQAFKGVSLFIGLVFSLGSTSLIGNLISGYSLTYRSAFKPGDRVKIGEYTGDVQESRLLITYLRSITNEIIAVPNSSIVNTAVVNYSSLARTKGLILHTSVGIGYETPLRQVEAMLIEAATKTKDLLHEPKPFVLIRELRSFDVDYEINVYCDRPNEMAVMYARLHKSIMDVFNEYGVQIMTPAYVADPAEAKVVPQDQWYTAPAVSE